MDAMAYDYWETALWSSTDENGAPLDETYFFSDISEQARKEAESDLSAFVAMATPYITPDDTAHIAHDFWLTRNHHGAGFWDGDYEHGDTLTEIAHSFGTVDLYIGDDGKIYS